jgi:hypothetical protein
MEGMTTVVAVHETRAPADLCLVALCDEHITHLHRARWAHIDELVGFSTVMGCEACPLVDRTAVEVQVVSIAPAHHHLHALP